MTTTQAIGVALILLGVAYAIVWVGWLRRRPTETPAPVASEESVAPAAETSDVPTAEPPAPVASEESVAPAAEISDVPAPAPVASEESVAPSAEISDAAPEEPVDASQGVAGRYLGTTSPDGVVAKDLTRAADAILTVAYGALAWRPTKGTALRAEAAELVAVDGLEAGRSAADTPLTVRWHPPAAPGTTYETRFVPATPGGRAALADALRTLRPDLIPDLSPTADPTADPAPEETA